MSILGCLDDELAIISQSKENSLSDGFMSVLSWAHLAVRLPATLAAPQHLVAWVNVESTSSRLVCFTVLVAS